MKQRLTFRSISKNRIAKNIVLSIGQLIFDEGTESVKWNEDNALGTIG